MDLSIRVLSGIHFMLLAAIIHDLDDPMYFIFLTSMYVVSSYIHDFDPEIQTLIGCVCFQQPIGNYYIGKTINTCIMIGIGMIAILRCVFEPTFPVESTNPRKFRIRRILVK